MFPTLKATVKQSATALERMSETFEFRISIAGLFAVLHLVMFVWAGSERLDLPFNTAPDQAPFFSNVHAPATRGFPRQPHHWSRLLVSRWDAQHYIGFALRGLRGCPDQPIDGPTGDVAYLDCGLSWLPAWGKAGGIVADVVHAPPDYTLMTMSMLATVILGLLWTSKTIVERIGRFEAYAALIAVNMFPTGFYLVTPYAEAATLALGLGGLICLFNRRWIYAGLLIGAATALRPTAIGFAMGLSAAAAIAAWRNRQAGEQRWWWPLVAVPLSGWGLAVELLMLQIYVGDATAYFRAQAAFYTGVQSNSLQVLDPVFWLRGLNTQHMDFVILLGLLVIVAVAGRDVLRRFQLEERAALIITSLVVVAMPLVTMRAYWSFTRYLMMAPLAFLCAGAMSRKHRALFVGWLVLCALFYWHVELCSYLTQGDPQVCPCLGRPEFYFPFQS